MNKQQYQAINYRFRERMRSITGVSDFPTEQRDDVRRLMNLRDRADMLQCRADMADSGVHSLRMRLTHCTPRLVLQRLYGTAI